MSKPLSSRRFRCADAGRQSAYPMSAPALTDPMTAGRALIERVRGTLLAFLKQLAEEAAA